MLIDTYAWVEFFLGSDKGKKVDEILENTDCYTSIVTISEIVVWCLKNNFDKEHYINIIENSSEILNLEKDIVELAGKINYENKKRIRDFGMIDSLIYATARYYNLKVLTGDKHFENLEDAELL